MSNTKQQNPPDPVEMLYIESPSITLKQFREAIDRLVTEAKQDVLKELVEWYEYALSVDDTSFDWYRAVKALMVSKDHKKPFSQLSNKENI